jgi:predicted Zn-dependent protease
LIAMMGGAVLGGGGLTGQLAQMGIGLGANSVLTKFSRGAESDADLLGSYTMAKAGYNPVEMARFFEKLEAESGKRSGVSEWFSSHPNPGNRVKGVEEQLPYMARGPYNASEGDLQKMKAIVAKLPQAPQKPKQPAQGGKTGQGGDTAPAPLPSVDRPRNITVSSNMTAYRGNGLSLSHPDNWKPQNGKSSVTIAPAEGLVAGSHIGYGLLLSSSRTQSRVNLEQDTQALIKGLAQNNSNVKIEGQPERITVGGSPALVTRMTSDSPYANTRETDVVITVDRGESLLYLICIAPQPDFARFEPSFQNMVRSIRFE